MAASAAQAIATPADSSAIESVFTIAAPLPVTAEPVVVFHIKSSNGWSMKGTVRWSMFVATLRGVMRSGEELEILILRRVSE